jgi:hypothetical protein
MARLDCELPFTYQIRAPILNHPLIELLRMNAPGSFTIVLATYLLTWSFRIVVAMQNDQYQL